MASPLVSVVLPVYNGAAYVADAMRSVLRQQGDGSLELIVINDGSTDGSGEIVRRIAQGDSRVRIISRENRGFVNSLNEGIQASEGEWIARMDADDICTRDRLMRQVAWAREQKAEVCGGWIRTFGHTIPRIRKYPMGNDAARLQLLFSSCFGHPSVIARREVFARFSYDLAAEPVDDYELWTRFSAAGVRLTNCPAVVLNYRVHQKQMTATKRASFDEMRAKVAEKYRQLCFPSVPQLEHGYLMSRQILLNEGQVMRATILLRSLLADTGDPEHVITDNAFLFLARHAQVGTASMKEASAGFPFGRPRRLLLQFLGALGANQQSLAFRILYALK